MILSNTLQARPVTALDNWNDFELRHEFDSPIISNSEYFTKANTGEVLPGASSPLSVTVTSRALDLSIQTVMKGQFGRNFEVNPWAMGRLTFLHQNQVFLNVIETLHRVVDEEISNSIRAVDMAVFGHL